ncbi:MAG: ParB/RepB/Spo0J family partition protein [Sphingobacteriales bacterium]|nr:ParB/RepB/Spo0J family partition protein [Sphingobacteriales bacterium]
MTVTTKNKKTATPAIDKKSKSILPDTLLKDAEFNQIRTEHIALSPLNYRKYINEEALQQFAEELAQHGIISPLTVRPVGKDHYELVAGERRLRAAKLAGLPTVPVAIVNLTDEQVIEIQLSENLQRENPHPMHEAEGIGQMQRSGKTIDEIAIRLGKSKQFVYTRLKLLHLIDSFQEMVLANILSLQDALQIATLSQTSQDEFFADQCAGWKKQKNFSLSGLNYHLNQYRYDLKRAPFNTRDKKLVSEAGACTTCPSNSATLKTLFPEYAKQAICSNKECYNNKCTVHFLSAFTVAVDTYQPVALLYSNQLTEMAEKIIALIPNAASLPQQNIHEVTVIEKPEAPDKENYTYDNDEDEPELDEQEYNSAVEQYNSELEAYTLHTGSGHYGIGLRVDNQEFDPVYFSMDRPKPQRSFGNMVSAKEVQAAIKSGEATPELLEAEIQRIQSRENRAEELDREKVQLLVHSMLAEHTDELANIEALTDADMTAARLLIYQSLDYYGKQKVSEVLFKYSEEDETSGLEQMYMVFQNLTDQQFAYLIRMALCNKSESKYPRQDAGYFLYQIATAAGLPVSTIEQGQQNKATERKEKQLEKISQLEKKIKKLTT